MRSAALMLAAAVTYTAAIAGCVFLALNSHPIVGVIVLLAGLCTSFKSGSAD